MVNFFRNKRGYYFWNPIAQIGKTSEGYFVQMKLSVFGVTLAVWTLYRGDKKPRITDLRIISLLAPVFLSMVLTFSVLTLFLATLLVLSYILNGAVSIVTSIFLWIENFHLKMWRKILNN